ncbi:Imm1 family immunity protein [Solwaraspora sp. WMMA2056]|uniref:Imm1 family immunity protein n=1 Tax=Solwaraspora sp. WMMA2056 TaxID=3015161 RepID=UPI00259BEAE7|nr:Imm1 family immunity protein [Solwaraspora sp. WMMA2056]WJK42639.1 Imm1 family immunity protein [Solwaraspora sp. WMMA2056]
MLAITWGGGSGEAAVVSGDELRGRLIELDRHAAARPFIVDVTIDSGDTISVALGREVSVLNFTSASKKPPYFASEGRLPGSRFGVVRFEYFGSMTEFPEWQAVSRNDALEAVCRFVAAGVLPDNILWSEV